MQAHPPIYAIAPTQYTDSGDVDAASMVTNMARLSALGIEGVLLTGSYGEFQNLTDDERVCITTAFAHADVVSRIMSGGVQFDTGSTIRTCHRLLEAGAHEAMVAGPIAAECSAAEVDHHFDLVGDAVGSGLIVYNNPVFGRDLGLDTLAVLSANPAYCGVKQGTLDLPRFLGTIALAHRADTHEFRVIAAADLHAIAALSAGSSSITSTNVWVFPAAFRAIVEAVDAGDLDRARAIRSALAPYARFVIAHGQPRSVKAAMLLRGYSGTGFVRPPYRALEGHATADLAGVLDEVDAVLAKLDAD